MAELADAPDLGSGGETLGGSSPLPPTKFDRVEFSDPFRQEGSMGGREFGTFGVDFIKPHVKINALYFVLLVF